MLALRRSEATHGTLLDDLEQLGLENLRQEPNLVQEDGASMRGLEQAGLRASGVGEGAAFVAEELGLE